MSLLEPPTFASFADLEREALACTKCPLAGTRTQVVFGVGDPHADLLFVGEGPGEQEDLTGEPFVGRAGRLLTSLIEGIGLTRDDVYIANVVKCRPPGNRDPLPPEIETCRPYLEAQVEFIDPRVVVTLGNFATKLLSGRSFGITRVHGQEQALQLGGTNVLLYPLYHPAAALYTPTMLQALDDDFSRLPGLLGRATPVPVPPNPLSMAEPEQRQPFEAAELADDPDDDAMAAGATQLGLF